MTVIDYLSRNSCVRLIPGFLPSSVSASSRAGRCWKRGDDSRLWRSFKSSLEVLRSPSYSSDLLPGAKGTSEVGCQLFFYKLFAKYLG